MNLIAILLAGVAAFAVQAPAQNAAQQNQPASIDGVVIRFGSNDGIAQATVELRKMQTQPSAPPVPGVTPPPPLTFTTDSTGRFQFPNVAPGEYRLYVTRETGYTPSEYGQRSPSGSGIPLIVEAGGRYSGIRLSMTPVGSVGGHIIDRNGEPAEYARISLMRSAYRDGQRIQVVAQTTSTDDRGEYRFYSLPPGKYYVVGQVWDVRSTRVPYTNEPTVYPNRFAGQQTAGAPLTVRRVLENGDLVDEVMRSVYYPGTAEVSSARVISLQAGGNIQGIDFSLAAAGVRSRHFRGTVIDGETGGPAAALVRLVPRQISGRGLTVPVASSDQNGAFDVEGGSPEAYSVFVTGANGLSGYAVIGGGEADINGLRLVMTRGVDLPWRAAFDQGIDDQGALAQLRITLVRDPDTIGPPLPNTTVTAGWSGLPQGSISPRSQPNPGGGFVFNNVPFGDYRLKIAGVPRGAHIKSVRQGNRDVLRDGLSVAGPIDNPLEIVLGRAGGKLEGNALNSQSRPEPNVSVVLVPMFDRFRTDLYRNITTDSAGRFQFDGIAPGQYKVFAWEDVESGAWHDPDFIRVYESRGVTVDITVEKAARSEVQMIPWSATQ